MKLHGLYFLSFCLILYNGLASAQTIPDYYEESGINSNRDQFNVFGFEKIDPFSGKLSLHHTDIYLPGNGGLDLSVFRSYTSRGITAASIYGHRGVNGIGWTLHFG